MEEGKISQKANVLVSVFEKEEVVRESDKKISVNRVVSEVASWYEKLRNAMDIREEEVILRAAIERILKRRVLLGGTGRTMAAPLVRELIWARYFPDASIPEAIIEQVEKTIDLYATLRAEILDKHKIPEHIVTDWFYHLLSVHLVYVLKDSHEKDTMANFMFGIVREHIVIADEGEQTRDAQVFIAVRRSFAKDDIAFLRFHLFEQLVGRLTEQTVAHAGANFAAVRAEIERQLRYPFKEKILSYVKKKTPPFFILEDLFKAYRGDVRELSANEHDLKKAVFAFCAQRYSTISARVRRAIIRSVIFILLTKAVFAFMVEGTYESLLFGQISWATMAINISIPPLLMVVVGFFIKTPGRENSERIFQRIQSILFDEEPKLGEPLFLKLAPAKTQPFTSIIFTFLWLLAFGISFGVLAYILFTLHFHIVSVGVFTFFLTIVSFLAYRISQTAHIYVVDPKPGLLTPIIDFFFLPIIQVGRHLTDGIAQLNLILFIFDFIIETPFKGIFGFFEQWFLFLHAKREELG